MWGGVHGFDQISVAGRHLARPIQDIHTEIANKKGFPPDSFNVPDDTRAYWLCKNKDAEKVLVWFHGDYCRILLLSIVFISFGRWAEPSRLMMLI